MYTTVPTTTPWCVTVSGGATAAFVRGVVRHFCEPEIGELGVSVFRDEHVLRLDVAVEDSGVCAAASASATPISRFDDLAPGSLLPVRPSLSASRRRRTP